MATLTVPSLERQTPYIGPHGNSWVNSVKHTFDAAQNDLVNFMRLPRGLRIFDVLVVHSAFGASVVLDLGLAAVAGGSVVKVDADALIDGADIAAAGLKRRDEVGVYSDAALTLDDDYYLQGLFAGANPDSGTMEIVLSGQYLGVG